MCRLHILLFTYSFFGHGHISPKLYIYQKVGNKIIPAHRHSNRGTSHVSVAHIYICVCVRIQALSGVLTPQLMVTDGIITHRLKGGRQGWDFESWRCCGWYYSRSVAFIVAL